MQKIYVQMPFVRECEIIREECVKELQNKGKSCSKAMESNIKILESYIFARFDAVKRATT